MQRVDLANSVTVREQGRLTRVACYAASDASHGSLRSHTKLPFIVFGGAFVKGVGSFGQPKLDKALRKGVSLRGLREPLCLYPFSLDDPPSVALRFIISGIVSCIAKSEAKPVALLLRKAWRMRLKRFIRSTIELEHGMPSCWSGRRQRGLPRCWGKTVTSRHTTKRCSMKASMPAPYRRLLIVAWKESTLGSGGPG